jgi:uncharacterized membrane protein (UPF0182 family)
LKRLGIVLLVVVGVVTVLIYALRAFVAVYTNVLWFRSVHYGSVYTRTFWTQVLLFGVFGVLMAAAIAAVLIVFHRFRPAFAPDPATQRWRYRFMRVEPRLRWWLFVVVVGYLGISMGNRAASNWQTWLLWRNAVPWHQTDPQFHRDISYFVDVYPLHRLVLTLLFRIVATALIILLVVAYAYGALRLRGTGPRMNRAVKAQVSLLLGLYLVLKALAYGLDRMAVATSNRGPVTGPSYTDVHAVLPGKVVLIVIAAVCALLLFANVAIRSTKLTLAALAVMAVSALVVGVAWPAVVQRFREGPSAGLLDLPDITHNQSATLQAFGLSHDVTTRPYDGTGLLHGAALSAQAARNAQIRLLDPNRLSPTFNVKQQLQAYYGFKSTLDIDRYLSHGASQDVALAVRELNLSGISRNTWTNAHLVYTHGYGVVAAPTDRFNNRTGTPNFINGGLPAKNEIPVTRPQIYYGQMSPSYSIVGLPAGGAKKLEFDHPSTNGSAQPVHSVYTGGGGVPIGTLFDRLVYAIKLHSASVLLSSQINNSSQLLTVRNPSARVAAVAPWLTLDGDTYPAVVDGRIVWVVDGYTTSNSYPNSQQINLRSATASTLSSNGATATQPNASVNYMRNSVKATVDAYSGKVTLYAWNQAAQPDPILQAWEQAFPGLIEPQAKIPAAVLPHLRYPQDLFNVQRSLLTRYHVSNASDFYNGSDFWKIPTDPTVGAANGLNSPAAKKKTNAQLQASVYMSLSPNGYTPAEFSLSTPMVTLNSRDLAAFLSVDSQPGPNYGKFSLLELPAGQSVESPAQIQNDIESANTISKALTLQRGGNSKVVLGNLLTIPLAGKMLYVEPVFTQATGGNSFPILRHVVAVYGKGAPAFKPTLSAALKQALGPDTHSRN